MSDYVEESAVEFKVGEKIRSKLSGAEYFVGRVSNGIIHAGLVESRPDGWAFLPSECEKVEEKVVEFKVGDTVRVVDAKTVAETWRGSIGKVGRVAVLRTQWPVTVIFKEENRAGLFAVNELELVEEKAVEFQKGDKVSVEGVVIGDQKGYVKIKPSKANVDNFWMLKSAVTLVERPKREIPVGTKVEDPGTGTWILASSSEGNAWVRIGSRDIDLLGDVAKPSLVQKLHKIARESL